MTKFLQLDERIATLTPRVRRTDVVLPRGAEIGAFGHWLLGQDAGSLTAIDRRQRVLTPQGPAPSYSSNFATISRLVGNELRTPLADIGQNITMWVVFRLPGSFPAGITQLCGNSSNSGPVQGRMIYLSGQRGVGVFGPSGRSSSPLLTAPESTWLFVAASIRTDITSNNLIILGGGQAAQVQTLNFTGHPNGTANFGVANTDYGVTAAANVDYAEFGIFDYAASAQELADIYTNSQARMSSRGITLGTFPAP
jgi:hypothetical protein